MIIKHEKYRVIFNTGKEIILSNEEYSEIQDFFTSECKNSKRTEEEKEETPFEYGVILPELYKREDGEEDEIHKKCWLCNIDMTGKEGGICITGENVLVCPKCIKIVRAIVYHRHPEDGRI